MKRLEATFGFWLLIGSLPALFLVSPRLGFVAVIVGTLLVLASDSTDYSTARWKK